MSIVATLISNPRTPILDDTLLKLVQQVLPEAQEPVWLSPGVAVDILLPEGQAFSEIERLIRTSLGSAPLDVIVQRTETRRKKLLLADMDSTMIGQECIDELADFVGLKEQVSRITERAMQGEIAFEPALRERVALLKNLPVAVVDQIIEERLTLTPGARQLVRTMRANGAYTCLVSGGFTLFTSQIGSMIGFNEHRSNHLIVENGKLSGEVADPIIGREEKLAALIELRSKFNLTEDDTLAIGDGANDLAMLEGAGLGVAFYAKPAVASIAKARINYADLSALLYAQGYHQADIIED